MAGDWIKMRVCLAEEREVVQIHAALGMDRFAVVGRLHKIWSWADTHTTDGNAVGVTSQFLDELVNCLGFAKAMRDACWLEGRDGSLSFPKFSHHNGQTAKTRALTGNRVKRHRNADAVTESLSEKRREDGKSPQPPPAGGLLAGLSREQVAEAEAVYVLYPRKTKNREAALREIHATLLFAFPEQLRGAVTRYAKLVQENPEMARSTPAADKWFRNGCWKDYVPKVQGPYVPLLRPSSALCALREFWSLRREPTVNEVGVARLELARLTTDDHAFLSDAENERIKALQGEGVVQ